MGGLVGGYLVFAQGGDASGPRRPAPEWQATSIDGDAFSSTSLRGDVYAVDFFFTWCQICKAQLPHKKALVERFQDDPDFHFLSVSADPSDSRAALDEYRTAQGALWPFAQDRDGLYQKFRADSRPFIVFVDRNGDIVQTIRTLTEADKLIRIVEPLLAQPAANDTTTPSMTEAPTSPAASNTTTPYGSWVADARRR